MNLRNLFRFRYYRKLVCSFVLIGVLLVSMAVVCISIMFSRMTVKRVGEMSVSSVRQVADSLDTLLENCQNAADILMNERYFTSVAGSYTLDRLKEYALMSSIMKLKINYPYIRHMGIVNGRLDRYVGTRGVYFGCEDSIKEADLSQENHHYAIFSRNVREYENTEESRKAARAATFPAPTRGPSSWCPSAACQGFPGASWGSSPGAISSPSLWAHSGFSLLARV